MNSLGDSYFCCCPLVNSSFATDSNAGKDGLRGPAGTFVGVRDGVAALAEESELHASEDETTLDPEVDEDEDACVSDDTSPC